MRGSRFALWALAFMTVTSLGAIVSLLLFVDPSSADTGTLSVFYLTVFVSVTGIVTWAFLLFHRYRSRARRPLIYFFADAVRQGGLVGGLLTTSLFLQAQDRLTLLTVIVIVAVAFILEAFMTRGSVART